MAGGAAVPTHGSIISPNRYGLHFLPWSIMEQGSIHLVLRSVFRQRLLQASSWTMVQQASTKLPMNVGMILPREVRKAESCATRGRAPRLLLAPPNGISRRAQTMGCMRFMFESLRSERRQRARSTASITRGNRIRLSSISQSSPISIMLPMDGYTLANMFLPVTAANISN